MAAIGTFLTRVQYSALPMRAGQNWVSGQGLRGLAVDKAERWGGALAFGAAKGYWREKFIVGRAPLDLWIGAGASLLSVVLSATSFGTSPLAPHLERVGDAGMMSWLNSMGTSYGASWAGRKPELPAWTGVRGEDAVGELPPVTGGALLSAEEIARYAQPRA